MFPPKHVVKSSSMLLMFILQKRPKWMKLKTEMCLSLGVERVTLWTSSSSVRPLPPLCKVHQCHLLSRLTYCSSITSVRVTCLFGEVIAARAMPPTWHMRLVSALTAAMPISSTETEAWQPTHKHTCKHHADTHTHTEPPLPSEEPDDGTGLERW